MKCSICGDDNSEQQVYCSMCKSWHCASHFNSALISSPGRLIHSPMIVDGHVDVHGTKVEATFRGARLGLSLIDLGVEEYSLLSNNNILGTVKKTDDLLSPWKAYVNEDMVGERLSPAGAVGCVIQAIC